MHKSTTRTPADWSTKLGLASFIMLAITLVISGLYWAAMISCDHVCTKNGNASHYELLGGGCYCRDEQGRYNLHDSRETD